MDVAFDISDAFLINGTARVENYNDFGNAFVWKLSSRYKFADDKLILRGSVSTGFRAPALHQIYTQRAQYSFVPGQGIQVGGLINNVSPSRINSNFEITADYYNREVRDRIVLSTEIIPPEDPEFDNFSDVSFFVNAIDTRTSGIDVVVNYDNVLGSGLLDFSLSGNYTIKNERDGAVNNPDFVTNSGQSVVNETQEALFFTSRPKTKWILGINYDIGKIDLGLYNTCFGKTTFHQQGLPDNLNTEFTPKIVTDLCVNFKASEKVNLTFNVNNLLNVLPEWNFVTQDGQEVSSDAPEYATESNLITFNQRYSQMTYDGYHFSQLGTLFNLALNVRF